jgi:hypothetical protein
MAPKHDISGISTGGLSAGYYNSNHDRRSYLKSSSNVGGGLLNSNYHSAVAAVQKIKK